MNISKTFIGILMLGASLSIEAQQAHSYVDPFIGTGAHGHTYPGASAPYGMVQLSPDTRQGNWDACSGYHYSDSTLMGFSHTHLSGTGCIDFGDILIRPHRNILSSNKGKFSYPATSFNHRDELASPGFYQVWLPDEETRVELSASRRVGFHRYTFEGNRVKTLIIDLEHLLDKEVIKQSQIKQTSPTEVIGMRTTDGWVDDQSVYFVAHFSQEIQQVKQAGQVVQLIFAPQTKNVELQVALSMTNYQGARANLKIEGKKFDDALRESQRLWDKQLALIQVEGGTLNERRNFYTALYHAMLAPNVTSDVSGSWVNHKQDIKQLPTREEHYSTLSLWDTFRAWHPLMTLIEPELTEQIIRSMLRMYQTTGELPIWPLASGETRTMIGYHAVSVIADAYLKGIRGFDANLALEAMIKSSNINRKGSDYYVHLGFIPANIRKESVSCLLEYAYDDWCIAQMAKAMGRSDIQQTYERRAKNYINVFDGSSRFFRGKNLSGTWESPFHRTEAGRAYTEATAWQYRFFVPHDVRGHISLMGGKQAFAAALDSLFDERMAEQTTLQDITGTHGQYAHGNEPSHHMAYLYNYIGMPHKTQEMTRLILEKMYQPTPDGISGNEDCGQMSAWYIFTSMGLYPVCPGSNEYVLTSPIFTRANIRLAKGKHLVIKSNASPSRRYIQRVLFNGKALESLYIKHQCLAQGGTLEFILGETPNKDFANLKAPYSLSTTDAVSIPYVVEEADLFLDKTSLTLGSATSGANIHYTLDGSTPTESSPRYTQPITLTKTSNIRAKAFHPHHQASAEMSFVATKAQLLSALSLGKIENGLRYRYYEGHFRQTSEIEQSPILKEGIITEPSLSPSQREDKYALIFEGYIYAPEDGIYGFYTKSDDGSVLFVGNQEVVNNEGSHSAIISSGKVALSKGWHPVRLKYFEDYSGQHLSWAWKLPKAQNFTSIPREYLAH